MEECDKLALWQVPVERSCNFDCSYCCEREGVKKDPSFLGDISVLRAIREFNKTGIRWHVHMSAGEPFLYPHFIEICEELTRKHDISFSTNLSSDLVYRVGKEVDPNRVRLINCSLHFLERQRFNLVEDFIGKVDFLKRLRVHVWVTQVMWPPIIKNFDEVFDYFRKEGIIIRPMTYVGYYKGKPYPESYTKAEKQKIFFFNSQNNRASHKKPALAEEKAVAKSATVFKSVTFRGLDCGAGMNSVYIDYQGNVRRCFSDHTSLGNIYEGSLKLMNTPEKCHAPVSYLPGECFFMCASGEPRSVTKPSLSRAWNRLVDLIVTPIIGQLERGYLNSLYSLISG